MNRYTLHIDLFDIDYTFTNVSVPFVMSGFTFFMVDMGTRFNLYEWVSKNIYLPNKGRSYSSEWYHLVNCFPQDDYYPKNYYIDMRFVYDGNKTVSVQSRSTTYEGYSSIQSINYMYEARPFNNNLKYLDLILYEYSPSLMPSYKIFLYIGEYSTMDLDSVAVVDTHLPLSAMPYINEAICGYAYAGISTMPSISIEMSTSNPDYNYSMIEGIKTTDEGDSPENQYSGEGGGQGVVNDTSDYIPTDGLPTISAISSGFVNVYNPSLAMIQALHTFMMGDGFIDNVKKLMASPIDYIISLHMLPVKPQTGDSETVKVGGVDTLVSMSKVISQYLSFDCGSINVDEYYGSFVDYSPYTKVSIFLPFVGIKELNLDDVMSSTLSVNYRIDVLTGNFVCSLQIASSRKVNAVLYNYSGSMSMSVPVSASDYRNKVSAFTSLLGSGAMVVASGGANVGADVAYASNLVNVALSKVNYSRSGSISGESSLLGNYTPYLIIARPNQSLASRYKALSGYPSNIGGTVGQFSGFNKFLQVKTDGLDCLEEEKGMIRELLSEGVFI